MIKLKNINKTYITKTGIQTNALKNINLEFPEKGLFFIIGKTGCGKSTLLNMIGKLDESSSGEILIGNTNLTKLSPKENDDYRNHFVGFVFQNYNLIEELTVYENIALVQKLQGKKPNKEEIEKLLEKLNLTEQKNKLCDEISGGQRQRVSIARALIKNPKIILADEPTGAIDSKTGREILNILKDISKEKLVIIVSHNIDFANNYADYIIKMADGKIIENSYQVKETPNNYVLNNTRGNIDFKECLKLSFFNLNYRIKRLITMILILIITFTGLGITSTFMQFDKTKILIESMKSNNITYLILANYEDERNVITIKEIKEIQEKYPKKTFSLIYFAQKELDDYDLFDNVNQDNLNKEDGTISEYFDGSINGEMDISEEITKKLKLQLVAGTYPTKNNEIIITKYHYELLERYDGVEYQINSYNDIVDKTIKLKIDESNYNSFKVTGIIDTRFNLNKYLEKNEDGTPIYSYSTFYDDFRLNLASFIFHNEGYLESISKENDEIKYYGVCTSINYKKDKKIINNFYRNELKPTNLYATKINQANKTLQRISKILYIMTIILIMISSLMLYIYVRNIIDDKRRQIGTLRTLGTTKTDILKIFTIEILTISIVISIFSCALTGILTNLLNQFLIDDIGIILKLLSFNFPTILIILIVNFVISFISTYIPISNICKLNPIESLKS